MAKRDELASVSSGIGQGVAYICAVVFLLLVLAGVTALVKYAWRSLAA